MRLLAVLLLATLALGHSEISLEGSKVYNVYPQTKKHQLIMQRVEERIPGLDIWQKSHVEGREAKILVPKHVLAVFEAFMSYNGIPYDVFMDDPKTYMPKFTAFNIYENEMLQNERARMLRRDGKISFTAYHRHAEINAYLDEIAATYPSIAKVETIGMTEQGRAIKAIKISRGSPNPNKPMIVADAALHAREWLSTPVALYMINKLVENVTESDVAANVDWIIIPVNNPDGYEYSHTNVRLWRKNRSVKSSTSCPGVDGNRNFDYKWMLSGSSSNPCSDLYAGPRAFSEIETQVVRNQVNSNLPRVKAYLAIHTYGSYVLYPYGSDGTDPPNVDELDSVGRRMGKAIDALAAPGSRKYLVGNAGILLNYLASGASDDYMRGVPEVPLTFTLELPGGGSAGFNPPPTVIKQVVAETWGGILVVARYVIENY